MWRWLPSALCNKSLGCLSQRRLFFLQLIGIVFGIHFFVFVLYGFIGWMQSGHDRFKISLTQSGATYVLMPLQKKVNQSIGQKNRAQNSDANRALKKSNVIDHETYQNKKNARKKSKSAAQKSTIKSTKNVFVAKSSPLKKQAASVMMKSEKKQSVSSKKLKQKKSITKIQDDVASQEVVQQLAVPAVALPQEKVVEAQLGPILPEQFEIESVVHAASDVVETDDFDEDNVIFVGYEELEQSMVGSKIQHEIQQNWTPPVGMSDNVSCEIRVKIDSEGQAIETKVTKSSGVFVFDASAKKTLQKIEYPKEVFNKNITIVLGSS